MTPGLPTGYAVAIVSASVTIIALAAYVVWGGDLDRWIIERRRRRRKGPIS